MSKTETTMKLEQLLRHKFDGRKDFFVFECTIGWMGKEIVDCIMYNCQREIYCYEIKQSVNDFHSKNRLTFIGNKNYFVMTYDLYQKVKEELYSKEEYKDIGVYVSVENPDTRNWSLEKWNEYNLKRQSRMYDNGFDELVVIKNATRRELRADKEVILSSMLRSKQNDTNRRNNDEKEQIIKFIENKLEESIQNMNFASSKEEAAYKSGITYGVKTLLEEIRGYR